MVIPMRKYAFMVHPADYDSFLEELRTLGVLHVQTRQATPEENQTPYTDQMKEVSAALKVLQANAPKNLVAATSPTPPRNPEELPNHILLLQDELDRARQKLILLHREIDALNPWGMFSLDKLGDIEASGWTCHFYTCPVSKFDPAWGEGRYLFPTDRTASDVWFVLFHPVHEKPDLPLDVLPTPLRDPLALEEAIGETKKVIDGLQHELARMAAELPALEQVKSTLEEKTDKARVLHLTEPVAEGAVLVLEGFVPRPVEARIAGAFQDRPVLFWAENPTPEDEPPVLLRNGIFAKLFEPISKLYALPAYRELDLTPYFAPFFMLFFGFCLGDAGYGIVILAGSLLARRRASASMKPILGLAHFLGAATILFGILTGTVFGINLLETDAVWLAPARTWMLDSSQTFNLALILGFVQTIYGLAIKAVNKIRQYSLAYGMPSIGWIFLLLALVDMALLKATGPIASYIAIAGIGLILLFSDPKAGIFGRVGKGLWDLYGITGFFGDLLSYIRLFALGVSSAVLGFVINDIALQIKGAAPVIGPILFVVFLLIGHTVNLAIASLGAFVHPMRLTFVEFYKNAGFEGGGKAYDPFARRQTTPDTKP